jgi:hypothetical protein
MAKTIKLEYDPQPKQALLHKCRARQILFGGAVGVYPLPVFWRGVDF